MNEIRIFNHPKFGDVRTTWIDGEPWFVGKDVATILAYENPGKAIRMHVDAEDKKMGVQDGLPPFYDALGREQTPVFINESGLYSLAFRSKLPEAKAFKHWVTAEVLPSIRKYGFYGGMIPQDYPSALRALADECEKNQRLESKIALDAPKVRFAECVADSPELAYVGQLAKVLKQNGIDIGRNRVFEWLRERGYIVKWATQNEPTQKAMNRELFYIVKGKDGSATPKLTQKGLIVLLNEIMDDYTGQNQMAII